MKKNLENTVDLLRRMYAGTLTEEEKREAGRLLEEESIRRIYEDVENDDYLTGEFRRYDLYKPGQGVLGFKRKMRKRKIRQWGIRFSVAAGIVLVFGTVWMWNAGKENGIENGSIAMEVGGAVVRLKLADGRVVAVEQDKKDLMEEGENTLIRVENGSLSYQSALEEQRGELKYNELSVPRGGECYLVLDDGTKVWLNADSYLRYPVHFGKNSRQVEIRGEGYFEVKPDGRPFSVDMGCGRVNVLGTSFGVRVYPQETALATLVEGKVAFAAADGQSLELAPGEQVRVTMDGKVSKQVVEVDEYVRWRDGWFVFREEALESVMNMMCRWYDVEVFYQTPALKEVRFTGNLKRYDSIEVFLEVLAEPGRVKYKISGKTVILYE